MVFGILVGVIIIALIVWAIQRLIKGNAFSGKSPEELIKERYAKGEITKKQFEEMKKELKR